MKTKISILDTTLRDGQQSPGAAMSYDDNLTYAKMAEDIGVDIIEAGFPAASKMEFNIVKAIANNAGQSVAIAALSQLKEAQMEACANALISGNGRKIIHTYFPVSPDLIKASIGEGKIGHIPSLVRSLFGKFSKDFDIQFSLEGFSRSTIDNSFVVDLLRAAVESDVEVINLPDTIGGDVFCCGGSVFDKAQYYYNILCNEYGRERINRIVWSVHFHNDFGLAVANSINSIYASNVLKPDGVRITQVEGCFTGVGERAGNASIEQIAMIIAKKIPQFETNIKTPKIKNICDFVSSKMLRVQKHYPIIGENAFSHSSGGHVNAILKDPNAYHPFHPEEVGGKLNIIFSHSSGGNHAQEIVNRHRGTITDSEKAKFALFVKEKCILDRKGISDIKVMNAYYEFKSKYKNCEININESGEYCISPIGIVIKNTEKSPLSILEAEMAKINPRFSNIRVSNFESYMDILPNNNRKMGSDACAISSITLMSEIGNEQDFSGVGKHKNTEASLLLAYLDALGKMAVWLDNKPVDY